MRKRSEFSEFLVIGFLSTLGAVLLFMIAHDFPPIEGLKLLKGLTTSEIIFITILTYVVGLLTHRILTVIKYGFLIKVLDWMHVSSMFTSSGKELISDDNRSFEDIKYAKLLQYGSDAAVIKVFSGESQLRIFKCITLLFIILPFIGGFWAFYFFNLTSGLMSFGFLIIIPVLSFKCHKNLKQRHLKFIQDVIEEIDANMMNREQV